MRVIPVVNLVLCFVNLIIVEMFQLPIAAGSLFIFALSIVDGWQ